MTLSHRHQRPLLIWSQLHFHGSPMDIGHGSIYGKCQGSCVDRGVWGGNVEKVSDLRMRHRSLPDDRDPTRTSGMTFVACG